jgi:AcrR family transcriptional regulator
MQYPASQPTADRLVSAAGELFGERGYAATTTRQIAERAGVNEVTLFRIFGNKAGVLKAWAEMISAETAGFVVAEVSHPQDLDATLRTLAELEVRNAHSNGAAAMRLAFEAGIVPEVREVLGEGPLGNLTGLTDYLRERQEAGDLRRDIDPYVMAEAFFSLTSSVVMLRSVLVSDGQPYDLSANEVVGQLVELFLSGVMPIEGRC